jgi:hypothetical protein
MTKNPNGTLTAEANLTFDGLTSTLALTGDLNVGSGDFFVDDSTGRVGIGTASPSKKLHIKDSTNEIVFIESSDANADIIGADTGGSTRFRSQSGSLDFYTGGSASSASASGSSFAMRIDTSQRVGIGTASPSEKLHVYGSVDNDDVAVHIQNAFDDNLSATPPSAALTFATASNNAYLRVFGAPADTADNHKIELGSTAVSSYITFKPSGSEAMRITSGGNVGIGTTTPSEKLDIRDGELVFTHSSLNQALSGRIRFNEYSSDSNVSGAYIQYNGASNYLQMFTNTESTDYEFLRALRGSHLLLQPSSGNVGIGTTSPGEKLEVNGSIALSNNTYFKARNSVGTLVPLFRLNSSNHIEIINGNSTNGDIIFKDASDTNMTIKGDTGNVGIGTTLPSAKLHIYNTSTTSDGDGSATQTASGQDSILLRGHEGTNGATYGGITWLGGSSRRRAMITGVAESTDTDFVGLAFYTQGTDGSGDFYESMRISHGGNVGLVQGLQIYKYQVVQQVFYKQQILLILLQQK